MTEGNKLTKDESYKIQLLRGISIIAVVCIHNTPSGIVQAWCRPFLNFAVAMFLFMSGMLSSSKNWKPIHRIKKIVIPYFAWSLIYTVLFSHNTLSSLPLRYAKNLVSGRSAAIMYYVFVYCQFTLLIPLIDRMANSKFKYLGLIVSPVEIILVRLVPLLLGHQFNPYVDGLIYISCLGWFAYFYLGYLIGNGYLHINCSTKKLIFGLGGGTALQILEGLWYFSLGETNCGTQLKLSAILTNTFALLLAYRFLKSGKTINARHLYLIGNYSFGIYFSHLAVMWVLDHLPYYTQVLYPLNAMIVIIASTLCVFIGKKILGSYSKYLAL